MGRNARGRAGGEGEESGSNVAEAGSPEEMVSQLLEGLGAGSRVMVERTWPGHAAGYLRYFEADEGTQACDLLEMIRASYGGGRFRIRPIGPAGKYARGSKTVQIAGEPRVETARASEPVFVAAPQPQRDPLVEVLLQRLLPSRDTGGDLLPALVGRLLDKGDSSADLTKELLLAALKGPQRERSSFSELREVVALMRELQGDVGSGGGGGGVSGGEIELLELLKLLKQQPAAPTAAPPGFAGPWPGAPPPWGGGWPGASGPPGTWPGAPAPPQRPPAPPAAVHPPAPPSSPQEAPRVPEDRPAPEFEPLSVDDYLADLGDRSEADQIELLRRVLPRVNPRVLQAVVAGDEEPPVTLTGGEWNVTAIGGRKG